MMCWICPIAPAAMDGPVALLFGLLRSVNPEVGQSGFIGIAASVVDNVAVDVIQQLTALPVCRDLPDDALKPLHAAGYDVPAEFGGVLSGDCIKNHQLDALILSFPDVLDPKGDHASQLEAEISIGDGLGFVMPDFRRVVT